MINILSNRPFPKHWSAIYLRSIQRVFLYEVTIYGEKKGRVFIYKRISPDNEIFDMRFSTRVSYGMKKMYMNYEMMHLNTSSYSYSLKIEKMLD